MLESSAPDTGMMKIILHVRSIRDDMSDIIDISRKTTFSNDCILKFSYVCV